MHIFPVFICSIIIFTFMDNLYKCPAVRFKGRRGICFPEKGLGILTKKQRYSAL